MRRKAQGNFDDAAGSSKLNAACDIYLLAERRKTVRRVKGRHRLSGIFWLISLARPQRKRFGARKSSNGYK
jgi:hypothetical protein